MIATTFDPLRIAKDLYAAGIERDHAEALAEAMRHAASADHGELATKGDLLAVKGDLRAEIAALNADLRAEIAASNTDLKAEIAALNADLRAEISASNAGTAALRADLYRVVWLQGGAVVAIVAALRFLPV